MLCARGKTLPKKNELSRGRKATTSPSLQNLNKKLKQDKETQTEQKLAAILIPILIGFLTYLSFITKFQGFIEAAFLITIYLIGEYFNKSKISKSFILNILIGFLLPFFLTLFYFILNGTFNDFITTIISANISYTSTTTIADITFLGIYIYPRIFAVIILLLIFGTTFWFYFKKQIKFKPFF